MRSADDHPDLTSALAVWQATGGYKAYMGQWSRSLAELFLAWFAATAAGRWLDGGCGPGALAAAVLATSHPSLVVSIDPALAFLRAAQSIIVDRRPQRMDVWQ
jgi:trans-aconitate methyltransferase